MPSNDQELRHDAASLLGFVDSIVAVCIKTPASSSYSSASKRFFQHIRNLGEATRDFLAGYPTTAPRKPVLAKIHRQKLYNLRSNWTQLHQFVKAAVDADTLQSPSPLLQTLFRRLRKATKFRSADFAIFHLD